MGTGQRCAKMPDFLVQLNSLDSLKSIKHANQKCDVIHSVLTIIFVFCGGQIRGGEAGRREGCLRAL